MEGKEAGGKGVATGIAQKFLHRDKKEPKPPVNVRKPNLSRFAVAERSMHKSPG
ncbi:hypothetical protein [Mesorhizobium sp.]|uniref:hypothetical protein n=1 Tax=Mesorhizobium sp. TaxID=1871066 RepID=UPI00167633D8|nr:hypothetical protein [Mesorhizobium sp.]